MYGLRAPPPPPPLLLLLLLCALVAAASCKSVFVGQVYQQHGISKVYETTIDASSIPLLKREKSLKFESPSGQVTIKGIAIKDLDNGLAEPSVTRGGLGFSFADIKLKSERGSGFKFLIEIYA